MSVISLRASSAKLFCFSALLSFVRSVPRFNMLLSPTSLVLLLSASHVFASFSSQVLSSAPVNGDVRTHVSTSFDTDIQCRTVMTTGYTGIVQTTTSTTLKTKRAKHSRSIITPPVSTIYRDAITVTVDTTTSTRMRTVTADAATDTVRPCTKDLISVSRKELVDTKLDRHHHHRDRRGHFYRLDHRVLYCD